MAKNKSAKSPAPVVNEPVATLVSGIDSAAGRLMTDEALAAVSSPPPVEPVKPADVPAPAVEGPKYAADDVSPAAKLWRAEQQLAMMQKLMADLAGEVAAGKAAGQAEKRSAIDDEFDDSIGNALDALLTLVGERNDRYTAAGLNVTTAVTMADTGPTASKRAITLTGNGRGLCKPNIVAALKRGPQTKPMMIDYVRAAAAPYYDGEAGLKKLVTNLNWYLSDMGLTADSTGHYTLPTESAAA